MIETSEGISIYWTTLMDQIFFPHKKIVTGLSPTGKGTMHHTMPVKTWHLANQCPHDITMRMSILAGA